MKIKWYTPNKRKSTSFKKSFHSRLVLIYDDRILWLSFTSSVFSFCVTFGEKNLVRINLSTENWSLYRKSLGRNQLLLVEDLFQSGIFFCPKDTKKSEPVTQEIFSKASNCWSIVSEQGRRPNVRFYSRAASTWINLFVLLSDLHSCCRTAETMSTDQLSVIIVL